LGQQERTTSCPLAPAAVESSAGAVGTERLLMHRRRGPSAAECQQARARRRMQSLPPDDRSGCWRAPVKGGVAPPGLHQRLPPPPG